MRGDLDGEMDNQIGGGGEQGAARDGYSGWRVWACEEGAVDLDSC